MSTTQLIILIVANIPIYFGIGWLLFDDWYDFGDAIRFWLTPDLISLIRGEWGEDWWAEMKLGIWAGACILCVSLELYVIGKV